MKIIIPLIVLTALIGGGFYVYQNQFAEEAQINDLTKAGWKVYRNEEYGFEFKRPAEVAVVTDTTDQTFTVLLTTDQAARFMYLTVTSSQFADISAYKKFQEARTKNTFSQTVISGVPALITNFESSSGEEITIIHDKLMYQFGGDPLSNGYNLTALRGGFALFQRKPGGTKIEQKAASNSAITSNKEKNAEIKTDISNLRVAAENYYDSHGSYGPSGKTIGKCSGTGAPPMFLDKSISLYLSSTPKAQCNVSASSEDYAAIVQLLDEGSGITYWCVDSLGSSYRISKNFSVGATSCPPEN